ncbi:MAG: hypothetical protein IPP46_17205 [Bacteroidetes bacterium]|nr:hypothetical protein [Bacteroidota bacterium]
MNPKRVQQILAMMAEDPGDPFCKYALALEYGSDESMKDKALELLKELILQHPAYLPSYYQLALHLRAKGEIAASGKVVQAGMQLANAQNNKHTFAELEFLLEELE